MKSRTWMWMTVVSVFAALVTIAQAEIVYTPVNVNLPTNGYYPIDLNHDGVTDFTFQTSQTGTQCGLMFPEHTILKIQPNSSGGVVGGGWVWALQSGVPIDFHQGFYGGDGLMYDYQQPSHCILAHSWGWWDNVKHGYLGLEFQINGQTHYGWAELTTNDYTHVNTLYGFAYETDPLKGIMTGQTMDSPDEPVMGSGAAEPGDSGPSAPVARQLSAAAQSLLSADGVPGMPIGFAAQEQQQGSQKLPRYIVTDLGTLGGTFAAAEGLNNSGWVEGLSTLAGDQSQHAFVWRNGVMRDLGTLGGPNSNAYYSPNERGEVTGNAETLTLDPLGEDTCGYGDQLVCLPFVWQSGVMTPLPTTLGGSNGYAHGINNRGQIVGSAENATHDPTCAPPPGAGLRALDLGAETRQIRDHATPPPSWGRRRGRSLDQRQRPGSRDNR